MLAPVRVQALQHDVALELVPRRRIHERDLGGVAFLRRIDDALALPVQVRMRLVARGEAVEIVDDEHGEAVLGQRLRVPV